jgi:hypothetical protein
MPESCTRTGKWKPLQQSAAVAAPFLGLWALTSKFKRHQRGTTEAGGQIGIQETPVGFLPHSGLLSLLNEGRRATKRTIKHMAMPVT